jgi:hypothetical protein
VAKHVGAMFRQPSGASKLLYVLAVDLIRARLR